MRQVAVALALLAALLAGCADGGSSDPQASDPAAFDDVVVTDTTGAIRGVVVNEAIVPIAGALISLNDGKNATSDDEGAFVFSNLDPGTYFLTARKLGYVDVQVSVDVVAGDKQPPVTKIQLALDPKAAKPFVQAYVFEGFIQCSGTFVAVSFAACSVVDIVQEGITQDNFGVVYPMDGKPTWMQTEMTWDSTQALGGEMTVQYSWDCGSENGGFLCDHGVGGASPLVLTANQTQIDEINEGDYNGTGLFVRSFNQGLKETDPDVPGYGNAPGGGLGLTVNQRFTYYSHFFYGYQPPEGWTFISGQPVPQPPA